MTPPSTIALYSNANYQPSAENRTDQLIEAAEREDVERVLNCLQRIEEEDKDGMMRGVNNYHSNKPTTALVAACSKEETKIRRIIVQILLLAGARLPVVQANEDGGWMELIRPWASRMVELGAGVGPEFEEVKTLINLEPTKKGNPQTIERSSSASAYERTMREAAALLNDNDRPVPPAFSTYRNFDSRSSSADPPSAGEVIDLTLEPDTPPSSAPICKLRSSSAFDGLKQEDFSALTLDSPLSRRHSDSPRRRSPSPQPPHNEYYEINDEGTRWSSTSGPSRIRSFRAPPLATAAELARRLHIGGLERGTTKIDIVWLFENGTRGV